MRGSRSDPTLRVALPTSPFIALEKSNQLIISNSKLLFCTTSSLTTLALHHSEHNIVFYAVPFSVILINFLCTSLLHATTLSRVPCRLSSRAEAPIYLQIVGWAREMVSTYYIYNRMKSIMHYIAPSDAKAMMCMGDRCLSNMCRF